MSDSISGQVSAVQHFSTGDGPGIRTTVFLKGCSLRCSWCHNPETQAATPQLMFFHQRCTSCGRCVVVCPTGAHRMSDATAVETAAETPAETPAETEEEAAKETAAEATAESTAHSDAGAAGLAQRMTHQLDRSLCSACGACVAVCPSEALQLNGEELSVDTVMKAILADRDFYQTSGGGVTLSGGEPLLQADFCLALARACKDHGIHVIADTAGQVPWSAFAKIIPFVDTFYFDVKGACAADYRRTTGGDFDLILSNLKQLVDAGAHVVACVVIIPGLNDDLAVNEQLSDVLKVAGVKEVRLLAYHRLGQSKYEALGRVYELGRRHQEQAAGLTDEVKSPSRLGQREQPEPTDRLTMETILAVYERSFTTWLDG